MPDEELIWDEQFLASLPEKAQRRLVRLTSQLIELEICRQYNLEPGSLLEELPDPIKGLMGPKEWEEAAETLAQQKANPLFGITDPDTLYEIHLKEEAKRKEVQGGDDGEA